MHTYTVVAAAAAAQVTILVFCLITPVRCACPNQSGAISFRTHQIFLNQAPVVWRASLYVVRWAVIMLNGVCACLESGSVRGALLMCLEECSGRGANSLQLQVVIEEQESRGEGVRMVGCTVSHHMVPVSPVYLLTCLSLRLQQNLMIPELQRGGVTAVLCISERSMDNILN